MNDTGGLLSQNRYMPFGKVRDITGSDDPIDETDFGYTGQRNLADISLMDYNARFYSPTLGRFLQPDTIVPEPGNPQAWNRYSYVTNNPVIYNDPTGHFLNVLIGAGIGALVGGIGSAISQKITTGSVDMKEVAKAAGVGAVAGVVAGVTFGIGTAVLGSGLGASIASGAASGITSGIASRTMDNALHKRKLTQGVFYGKAILTDAAVGGIFGALGYGLRKVIARRLLQRATNRANTALHDDILVAQDVLSEAEYTAGQNHEGVARMNYGKAVERGTADVIDDSRILGDLFEHVGGPGKPDFIGKGLFKGLNFDVTTKAAIPAHQIRPYGPGLIFSTYSRPAGFTTFPWIH
jgi:RHS repeat-associated protein